MYIYHIYIYIYICIYGLGGLPYHLVLGSIHYFAVYTCIYIYISSLCDRFLIENWSNLIWIQHGALELSLELSLHCKSISRHDIPFHEHLSSNCSLELQGSLLDWCKIITSSNFIRMKPEAARFINWVILKRKMIKFDMNPACSSAAHHFIDPWLKMIKLDVHPAWGSWAQYLIDAQLRVNQIWYESSSLFE